MKPALLITGGAGYIGSHTAYLMAQRGYEIIILDALLHNQPCNLTGVAFFHNDFADEAVLDTIFSTYRIQTVMHFAALIEVGRSVKAPLEFYDNNVSKTLILLKKMVQYNIPYMIFSSSCAVYGTPQAPLLAESHPKNPISPYGNTKLMIEMALEDAARAHGLRYVALRYFNAAGLLPGSGLGEYHEPETHIIPLLLKALRNKKPFYIYGSDYPTADGTCIRDYLHVMDIARAHAQALDYLIAGNASGCFNLGAGKGYSVAQLIDTVQAVTGETVATIVHPRRAGDPAQLVADPSKAHALLNWRAEYSDIDSIIESVVQADLADVRVIKSAYENSESPLSFDKAQERRRDNFPTSLSFVEGRRKI